MTVFELTTKARENEARYRKQQMEAAHKANMIGQFASAYTAWASYSMLSLIGLKGDMK